VSHEWAGSQGASRHNERSWTKLRNVQRVAIVGSGGAGKTTFANELGRRTGLPVLHLDHLYWRPGWVETPEDEWRRRQRDHLVGDQWIVDGNYAGTYDLRLPFSDTIIVLAPSRWVCTFRALRRCLRHHGRAVQSPGCPERVDLSFLWWVWRYPVTTRPSLDAALADVRPDVRVVELRTRSQVREYLDQVTT